MANTTKELLLDSFSEAAGRQQSNVGDIQSSSSVGDTPGSVGDTPSGAGDAQSSVGETQTNGGDVRSILAEFTKSLGTQGSHDNKLGQESPAVSQASETMSSGGQGQSNNYVYGESGTPAGVSVQGDSQTVTGSSTGSTIGSIATTFLESGLGIVPLVSGLLGLFGGGSSAPPALEKYTMPSAISFDSADTGTGLSASDFDQMGAPRLYSSAADPAATVGDGVTANPGTSGLAGGTSGGGTNAAMPQISVNVQTMDARSFLDNSDQIAQAVRGAMLNLSSINDVVNEL